MKLAALLILFVLGGAAISTDGAVLNKIHFTSTVESHPSPALDHSGEQIVLLLPPNHGTIYVGSVTYTASEPLRVAILHELGSMGAAGQHTWKIPGQDEYAVSYLGEGSMSDSLSFAGAALALYSEDRKFVATSSVDAFARGQPAEVAVQEITVLEDTPSVSLVRAEVPVTLPLHEGIFDDDTILYTITDSSDETLAERLTDIQEYNVTHAPPLSTLFDGSSTDTGLHEPGTVYIFHNGVKGEGLEGYQSEVFSDTPGMPKYTAASSIVYVEWKSSLHPRILVSADEIEQAKSNGLITLDEPRIILNMPQVSWPDGELPVRTADKPDAGGEIEPNVSEETSDVSEETVDESIEENDESDKENTESDTDDKSKEEIYIPETYQIESIDEDEMTATFIARRAWGPDGQTVYHIMAGATPSAPARVIGTADSPGMYNYTTSTAAADLYYFKRGVEGDGALGFQPSVAGVSPGTDKYTPLWRINIVERLDDAAQLVETTRDIDYLKEDGAVSVTLARPLGSNFVVNSPIVDPFQ